MSVMRRSLLGAFAMLLLPPARVRAAAPEPLPVQEVASGVFVYPAPFALANPWNGGAIANVGFVVGPDGVAVVDTGGSLGAGRRLSAAIRARTQLPIRYVINTHVHPDHVLGNAAFAGEGTSFVGHRNLPEALAARAAHYLAANQDLVGADFAGTRVVPPTVLVDGVLTLDLGGRRLRLETWPTAHTNTDVTMLDEQTDTWFMGDLLFVGHVPSLDGKLAGWIGTLRRLRARSAARVVPGHGPASVPWPQAAAPLERYLQRLESDVRETLREGRTMQEAASRVGRAEAGSWELFEDFNARNATTAFHELEWE
jgi:quinoprotein relay system zinc metallohydrolase 2